MQKCFPESWIHPRHFDKPGCKHDFVFFITSGENVMLKKQEP